MAVAISKCRGQESVLEIYELFILARFKYLFTNDYSIVGYINSISEGRVA
jgi:hypothetical protein